MVCASVSRVWCGVDRGGAGLVWDRGADRDKDAKGIGEAGKVWDG